MNVLFAGHQAAKVRLALTVNGRPIDAEVEPRLHLGDFLRESLDLTGTHLGCEHGVCGACTVLIDGEPARACLTFTGTCEGAAITTIEGLDDDEIAIELRDAFQRDHALQCGYCTPGMLVSARDLVLRLTDADDRRIRLGLSGNLCRCTGYVGIVRAIASVIVARRARGVAPTDAPGRRCGPVGAHPALARSPVPLPVAVGAPVAVQHRRSVVADFTPAHRFEQSFVIGGSPDAVFAAFGRIAEVAACIPGATIDAQPAPDEVVGAIRVRLGPIAVTFKGAASIERDEERRQGRIVGMGGDAADRSRVQGEIRYRVLPGEDTARATLALAIGYTLTGPLAQFGRPALVRDVAARIGAVFAANLEAHLRGNSPPPAPLDGLRLLAGMVRGWMTSALRRR